MPDGVAMQPREFEFTDVENIPQYWNLSNPVLTHFENAFSILIPPGEQFFIQSVRYYQDRVTDPEALELIRTFVQQEDLHGQAHHVYNATIANFGIDVAREESYAASVFAKLQRRLPRLIQLGITVFSEHLTAVGAHTLLDDPDAIHEMDPQMLEFWRWHAAEELEHKSVAFDLFRRVGGGYVTRMAAMATAVATLGFPMVKIVRRMMKEDPRPITKADRGEARAVQAKIMKRQVRLLLAYLKPGFHPWDIDDTELLEGWYSDPVPAAAPEVRRQPAPTGS